MKALFRTSSYKQFLSVTILDLSKPAEGTVVLFDSQGGKNQLWTYKDEEIYSKQDERYVLQANEDTKKVEVKTRTGKPNQKWKFYENGYVRNGTGLYLDTQGDEPKKDDELITYPKHTCKNQLFRQIYITDKNK